MKLNDKLWIVCYSRKISEECTVSYVGKKYFQIQSKSIGLFSDKFLISEVNKMPDTQDYRVYYSKKEYNDFQEKMKLRIKIKNTITYKYQEFSLEQILKVCEVLGI